MRMVGTMPQHGLQKMNACFCDGIYYYDWPERLLIKLRAGILGCGRARYLSAGRICLSKMSSVSGPA